LTTKDTKNTKENSSQIFIVNFVSFVVKVFVFWLNQAGTFSHGTLRAIRLSNPHNTRPGPNS